MLMNKALFRKISLITMLFMLSASFLFVAESAHASCGFITQAFGFRSSDRFTRGQVTLLQEFLAEDPSLYPEGLVTGFFGPATVRAVQRFQIQNGIVTFGTARTTGFGFIGPRTRAFINAEMCADFFPDDSASGPGTPVLIPFVAPVQVQPSREVVSVPVPLVVPTPPVPAPVVSPPVIASPSPVSPPRLAAVPAVSLPMFKNQTVTSTHRFQQGVAFGGWGPHLGKLLRSSNGSLYLVDDTGNDVNRNGGLAYYTLVNGQWFQAGFNPLVGTVQQNTGSVMKGDMIFTYGIDVEGHRVEECYFSTVVDYKGCNHLPFILDNNANYIGAALTPSGYTMVWWTNVGNNTGGTFDYIYNFGGGWNGPVSSGIAGYSAASYANIAFYDDSRFVLHAQLTTGAGSNWKFVGGYADGSIGNAITTWNMLSAVNGGDAIITTNDVWVDSAGGAHILARSNAGALAYYYRPRGGSFSGVLASFANVYRARFIDSSDGNIYVVYGKRTEGLRVIILRKSDIRGALVLQEGASQSITTPSGYSSIDAIYPESSIYQTTKPQGFHTAINGSERQGEVVHIELQ